MGIRFYYKGHLFSDTLHPKNIDHRYGYYPIRLSPINNGSNTRPPRIPFAEHVSNNAKRSCQVLGNRLNYCLYYWCHLYFHGGRVWINSPAALFYFPILYATYFYPSRGIYVAGRCAVAYLLVSVYFLTPNVLVVGGVVFQALLFIGIAVVSSYVVRQRDALQITVPEDDAVAVRMMIATGESERVEFKFKALWSTRLSKEEAEASESAEVRKYRTNASKFIVARSIAGFLNSSGGDLIIGIEEDRVKNVIRVCWVLMTIIPGCWRRPEPGWVCRMLIDSVIRRYIPEIYETASRYIHITFPVISQKTLCHVHITPGEKPIFVDTGSEEFFFIRVMHYP